MAKTILIRIHPQDSQRGFHKGTYTRRGVKFDVANGWTRLPHSTDDERKFVAELRTARQDDYDARTELVFEVREDDGKVEPKQAPTTLKAAIKAVARERTAPVEDEDEDGEGDGDGEGEGGEETGTGGETPGAPQTGRRRGRRAKPDETK